MEHRAMTFDDLNAAYARAQQRIKFEFEGSAYTLPCDGDKFSLAYLKDRKIIVQLSWQRDLPPPVATSSVKLTNVTEATCLPPIAGDAIVWLPYHNNDHWLRLNFWIFERDYDAGMHILMPDGRVLAPLTSKTPTEADIVTVETLEGICPDDAHPVKSP
jgi:hypothetical protein